VYTKGDAADHKLIKWGVIANSGANNASLKLRPNFSLSRYRFKPREMLLFEDNKDITERKSKHLSTSNSHDHFGTCLGNATGL
jgi:hypothetical protein